jgi:Protein of unknown function (DUF2934)
MKHTSPTAIPHQTATRMTKSTLDLQEQIRLRAYALYEQSGQRGSRRRRLAASGVGSDSTED